MRLLFDLVHPAHALFFHHAIRVLEANGAEILITSRDKDVLLPLLDSLGHQHTVLTGAGDGMIGLGRELVLRNWRLWRIARKFRPDVMAGCGGVSISHVGRLVGAPSVSFYDSEHATVQNRLALPFVTEWHVPEYWSGAVAKGRTFRFPGNKLFAYLPPGYFTPNPTRAKAAGWEPERDNFLIRLVAWKAGHDIGRSGMDQDMLERVVALLAARGRVHISAEGELPDALEPWRYRGGVLDFHHLLAMCRLCFGESATVASEAVVLGVSSVFFCNLEYGYVREQEEAGLIRHVRRDETGALQAIEAALAEDRECYRSRAHAFVAGKGDLNRYIVEAIKRVAATLPAR